jgi:hypothetical protein
MGDQAPPQFSADGNYWWDGEQWLPVDQLPRPLHGSSGSEFPSLPDHPGARRPPAMALVAGGLVVVLIVVVVAALGLTRRLSIARPTSSPSPRPTASVKPSPTPAYMQDVTLQTVLPLVRPQGLMCMDVSEDISGVPGFCQVNQGAVTKRVVIYGNTDEHIQMVRVVYRQDPGLPSKGAAAAFLGAVAGFPYPQANPAQAAAWISAHLTDSSASTTIGAMAFRSRVEENGHRFVVEIVSAS